MKYRKLLSLFIAFFLISFIGFTACDVNDDAGTGIMQVSMTDAPADYDSVFVDIQEVRIHRDADADTAENGWITILDEPLRVDLLSLRNGNQIPLGEVELETGQYAQMRFILGDDNELFIDGESHPLSTPSAQQTGLKLNVNAEIEDGETLSLLVDFDAGQSVVETGNGGFILKPVLSVINTADAGAIIGAVEPVDFQTYVLATNEEDTLSTYTNSSGEFTLGALTPGTYDVTFQPENENYQDSTLTDVEVTVGDVTDVGTIVLEQ